MPQQGVTKLTKKYADLKQLRQCVLRIAQSNNYVINTLIVENQSLKSNNMRLEGRVELLERVSKDLVGTVNTLREDLNSTSQMVASIAMSKQIKTTEVTINVSISDWFLPN